MRDIDFRRPAGYSSRTKEWRTFRYFVTVAFQALGCREFTHAFFPQTLQRDLLDVKLARSRRLSCASACLDSFLLVRTRCIDQLEINALKPTSFSDAHDRQKERESSKDLDARSPRS